MTISRLERTLLFGIPALVLLVAFVGVCVQAGTPWPWNRVVHEDGHRTLLQTIFYFEHATRELVLDGVLALAVAGAVRYFYPLPRGADDPGLRRVRRRMAASAVVVLLVILLGTAYSDGAQAILDNLAQYHTRENAPLVWGAHWRYHFIERLADFALAFALAGMFWLADGRPCHDDLAPDVRLLVAALSIFAAATLIYGPSTEPFRDPTFLGHQLRELLTHALVTVPLAVGTCLVLARRFSAPLSSGHSSRNNRAIIAAVGISVMCGTFLLVGSVLMKARAYGQKTGLAELIFPHFFEHSLGYILVAALAGYFYLANAGRPPRRDARNR